MPHAGAADTRNGRPQVWRHGLLTALVAVVVGVLAGWPAAAEPPEAFGPHRIERVGEASFILRLSGSEEPAGFIALRCLVDEQALIVRIGAPPGSSGFAPRQTITIWSDKTPATDVTIAGDATGASGIVAMNESAGLEAGADFMTLFEAVIGAEQHISYSAGGEPVTLDATHLQVARARFAELCARPAPAQETERP